MTVEQALDHPWIVAVTPEQLILLQENEKRDLKVFKRIKALKTPKRLQQQILLILVSLIDEKDFTEQRQTFQTIDVDHSGNIDKQELKKALERFEEDTFSEKDLEEILEKLDFDKNGNISYSEFLACTLARKHLVKINLKNLFMYLDSFGNGYLTKTSLLQSFIRRGKMWDIQQIIEMMDEIGIDPEGKIYFEQFESLITSMV